MFLGPCRSFCQQKLLPAGLKLLFHELSRVDGARFIGGPAAPPGDLISRIRAEKLDACPGVRWDLEACHLCAFTITFLYGMFPQGCSWRKQIEPGRESKP